MRTASFSKIKGYALAVRAAVRPPPRPPQGSPRARPLSLRGPRRHPVLCEAGAMRLCGAWGKLGHGDLHHQLLPKKAEAKAARCRCVGSRPPKFRPHRRRRRLELGRLKNLHGFGGRSGFNCTEVLAPAEGLPPCEITQFVHGIRMLLLVRVVNGTASATRAPLAGTRALCLSHPLHLARSKRPFVFLSVRTFSSLGEKGEGGARFLGLSVYVLLAYLVLEIVPYLENDVQPTG